MDDLLPLRAGGPSPLGAPVIVPERPRSGSSRAPIVAGVGVAFVAAVAAVVTILVAGGPGQGFLDVVELSDRDGDGRVTVRINTRYAGMATSAPGYPSGEVAYTSPEDGATRYYPGATLETLEEELNYNTVKLSGLRDQQGLAPNGRVRPLEPGAIQLTVASSDFIIDRSAYGDRAPLGSQMVIRDETDVRTVVLEPRELAGAQSLAAAGGPRLPDDLEAIKSSAGPRDAVARGDHLVFHFDVSGVFGYLRANDVSAESLQDERDEGLRLTIEESTDGGSGWVARSLGQTAVEFYPDPGTDSLYLAVQTGGTSSLNLQDGRYRARLRISGVDGKHSGYSTVDAYTGYPYLPPGEKESASATATIEPPTAAIVGPEEGSAPHLDANHSLVVRGTTSLAPGGNVRLEATSTEYAWDTTTSASVNETGHWTGSLDLSEAPGEEFTVALLRGDEPFDERTYTVRPPLENESGEGGSGGSSSGGESGGLVGGEDGGLLSGLPGLGGLAGPVGGGLGLLIAVWALWKLVITRMLL